MRVNAYVFIDSVFAQSVLESPPVALADDDDDDDNGTQWVDFEQDINNARLRCCILRFTSHKLEHWYCQYHQQKFRQKYNSVYLWLSGSALVYMLWSVLEHYVDLDDDYVEFNMHSPEWVRSLIGKSEKNIC